MAAVLEGSTSSTGLTKALKVKEKKEEHLIVVGIESEKKVDRDNALS